MGLVQAKAVPALTAAKDTVKIKKRRFLLIFFDARGVYKIIFSRNSLF